jgi:hypothetical protein
MTAKSDARHAALKRRRDEAVDARALADATEAWQALSRAAQRQLVAEIVETRGEELCRAYPDICSVGYGYRTKRMRAGPTWMDESAVCFVVARKRPDGHVAEHRILPRHLWAYTDVRGKRRLCAVPTDIESHNAYRRGRAQAGDANQIVAFDEQGPTAYFGNAAAVVNELPGNRVFLLSCLHVLALWASFPRASKLPSPIRVTPSREEVPSLKKVWARTEAFARLSGYRGSIMSGERYSRDLALAEVTDPSGLSHFESPYGFSSYCRSAEELQEGQGLYILTPRKHVAGKVGRAWPRQAPIELGYRDESKKYYAIYHELIYEAATDELTLEGDSGSAVVSRDKQKLYGMHIWGGPINGVRRAAFIPAWLLMDPMQYGFDQSTILSIDSRYRFGR